MRPDKLKELEAKILSAVSGGCSDLWSICKRLGFLKSERQRSLVKTRLDLLASEGVLTSRVTEKGHMVYTIKTEGD